jgi:ADP-ribosyl-[dinitrogen reductase] hydrolase
LVALRSDKARLEDKASTMAQSVGQDRFLGALFGMAIGDAMGMPVTGMKPGDFEAVTGYRSRTFADGTEIGAGEFTDESEIALCIVESATVNDGLIDPDNIAARMRILARGESKRWMDQQTLRALEASEETLDSSVPLAEDESFSAGVAVRGVPIGLLHAVGSFKLEELRADAETVARITHGSPAAISAVTATAFAIQFAAREPSRLADLATETAAFLGAGALSEALASGRGEGASGEIAEAFRLAVAAESVEDAVLQAANQGGAADSRAAIAGAIRGAADAIASIPQRLIDDLEGRIYISLAAPWFFRAAQRRGGLVINVSTE